MNKKSYSPAEPPLSQADLPGQTSDRPNRHSETGPSAPLPPSQFNTGRSLGQILIVLVVLLVLVNIPLNFGLGVAQLKPDSPSVVIRNGMLLQGSGPEVYLLEDHKLRWISSSESFSRYFNQHRRINLVEDRLLQRFEQGRPIRHLVKCADSPLIYALDKGRKQWVQEPPPPNPANPWDKVHLVPCKYLHSLPADEPISEAASPPVQPGMAAAGA